MWPKTFTLTSLNNASIGHPFWIWSKHPVLKIPTIHRDKTSWLAWLVQSDFNRVIIVWPLFNGYNATSEAKSCVISFKSHPTIAGDIPQLSSVQSSRLFLLHILSQLTLTLAALASAFFGWKLPTRTSYPMASMIWNKILLGLPCITATMASAMPKSQAMKTWIHCQHSPFPRAFFFSLQNFHEFWNLMPPDWQLKIVPAHSVEASTIRSWRWQIRLGLSPPACPGSLKLWQVVISNGKAKTFQIRTFPKTLWKQDILHKTAENQNVFKGHTSVLSVNRASKGHFTQRSLGHTFHDRSQRPASWFRSHYGHVGCGAVATCRQRDGSPSHHASSKKAQIFMFKFGF